MADDAARVLESLQMEAAHIFGFSMGGMIAQELALNYRQKVKRLILGCTHAGGKHFVPPPPEVIQAFSVVTDDWSERIRVLAPFAFSAGYRERHPQAVERFIAKKSRDVQPTFAYWRQLGAVLRHDAYDRLGEIASPTLVLSGQDDPVLPSENSRILAERIPNAELLLLEGAGHLFFLEQPNATVAAIRRFLGE
jgi:pimeloyl-ACP methyl ester carboxylesterase